MASDNDSVKIELGSPIFRAATIDVIEGVTLPPPPYLTPAQESKLWRKMDLRLLPILAFIYLMAFMDRGDSLFFGFLLRILVELFFFHPLSGNIGVLHCTPLYALSEGR